MKFTKVQFEDNETVNSKGKIFEFEAGQTYKLPLKLAEKMAEHGDVDISYDGVLEVDEDDVEDEFAAQADEEPASEEYQWLESRTVGEVEEDVKDIEDVDQLQALDDESERKGAHEAIDQRLKELRSEEDTEDEE